MFETFQNLGADTIWDQAVAWCNSTFWNLDTLYQIIIIVACFVLGALSSRFLAPYLERTTTKLIETFKIQKRFHGIIENIKKLLFPFLTFIILSLSIVIIKASPLGIYMPLGTAMTKVLFAWIVIRLAFQFIENSAIRNFFALITWSIAALSIFGVLENTMGALDSFAFSVGDFRLSALAVIKSILLLFALLYVALFLSGFAERRVQKIKGLTRSSQVLISKILRVILVVFAILIGLTSAGIDLSLFAVFGGAIGLGIGFGLQKGISNLFSGMLLLIDRSIKPGDVIEIPDIGTFGWVNHMAARYTEIVTRDNKSFLIPNEDFITQRVVNWSHGNSLIRLQVHFGVHYDSDPHEVKRLTEEATAGAHERIVDTPAPVCHLVEFGDSSLNFSLRFWIRDAEAGVTNIKGQVMLALWDIFKEHGIEIPYPHREIYMHDRKAEPTKKKSKAKKD